MAVGVTTKRAVVYGLLAFLTLWPIAHIALSKTYGMSPWKLAGWGMYATPRFATLGMEVFYVEDGSEERKQLTRPSPAEGAAAPVFLERYRWLGKLAAPDHFAQVIFDGRPNVRDLEIAVFQPKMEPDTGMVVMRKRTFEYSR